METMNKHIRIICMHCKLCFCSFVESMLISVYMDLPQKIGKKMNDVCEKYYRMRVAHEKGHQKNFAHINICIILSS